MDELLISKVTQRRFMLGKQGLWPGRRWSGKEGLAQALYYLWLVGEVMVHHRERFERVYDLLEAGKIPAEWLPVEPFNDDEVVFLAPLDIVSARGRSKGLFDFEYVWEVYKPAH